MADDAAETGGGRPRKRQAAKASTEQPAKKLKSTIHLSLEASRKLDIHATMMGLDRSALVEKLVHDHLRRWIVSDRGGASGAMGGEEAA